MIQREMINGREKYYDNTRKNDRMKVAKDRGRRTCRRCIRRQNRLLLLVLLTGIFGTMVICGFIQKKFDTVLADSEKIVMYSDAATKSGVTGVENIAVSLEDNGIDGQESAPMISGGWLPEETEMDEPFFQETASEKHLLTAVGLNNMPLTEEKIAAIKASDTWQNIFENRNAYPEALIKDLERNPEMLDFVKGYLTADTEASGGITLAERMKKCPLFIQWDERWGYVPYGQSNIGISGCGPTCLSMVLYSLTRDKSLTPDVLAERAMKEGYYVSGTGTAWSFMNEIAPQYGVLSCQIETWGEEEITFYLNEGKLLICAMGPGDFTDAGHFIVIRGYSNGKLLVNDPFSYTNSSKEWDYATIDSQCRQMWTFELQAE